MSDSENGTVHETVELFSDKQESMSGDDSDEDFAEVITKESKMCRLSICVLFCGICLCFVGVLFITIALTKGILKSKPQTDSVNISNATETVAKIEYPYHKLLKYCLVTKSCYFTTYAETNESNLALNTSLNGKPLTAEETCNNKTVIVNIFVVNSDSKKRSAHLLIQIESLRADENEVLDKESKIYAQCDVFLEGSFVRNITCPNFVTLNENIDDDFMMVEILETLKHLTQRLESRLYRSINESEIMPTGTVRVNRTVTKKGTQTLLTSSQDLSSYVEMSSDIAPNKLHAESTTIIDDKSKIITQSTVSSEIEVNSSDSSQLSFKIAMKMDLIDSSDVSSANIKKKMKNFEDVKKNFRGYKVLIFSKNEWLKYGRDEDEFSDNNETLTDDDGDDVDSDVSNPRRRLISYRFVKSFEKTLGSRKFFGRTVTFKAKGKLYVNDRGVKYIFWFDTYVSGKLKYRRSRTYYKNSQKAVKNVNYAFSLTLLRIKFPIPFFPIVSLNAAFKASFNLGFKRCSAFSCVASYANMRLSADGHVKLVVVKYGVVFDVTLGSAEFPLSIWIKKYASYISYKLTMKFQSNAFTLRGRSWKQTGYLKWFKWKWRSRRYKTFLYKVYGKVIRNLFVKSGKIYF